MRMLYVLHVDEDGDITLVEVPDFDKFMKDFDGCTPPRFMTALPRDLMEGTGGKYLLIRGEIIVPVAVDVVKRWELP